MEETNQLAPSAARLFLLSSILPVTTGASAAEIHFDCSQKDALKGLANGASETSWVMDGVETPEVVVTFEEWQLPVSITMYRITKYPENFFMVL